MSITKNLLKEVYQKKLDCDAAIDLYEKLYSEWAESGADMHLKDYMEMDNYEYTAFSQGADPVTIAIWRYEGWPIIDGETGLLINYKEYGWIVREIDNKVVLVKL